jgi:hypothetical protein
MANGNGTALNGNGNGTKWPHLIRIIEAIVIAGVTGLVAMYGASAKLEATVGHLCDSIKEVKTDVKDLRVRMDIISDRQVSHYGVSRDNNSKLGGK